MFTSFNNCTTINIISHILVKHSRDLVILFFWCSSPPLVGKLNVFDLNSQCNSKQKYNNFKFVLYLEDLMFVVDRDHTHFLDVKKYS